MVLELSYLCLDLSWKAHCLIISILYYEWRSYVGIVWMCEYCVNVNNFEDNVNKYLANKHHYSNFKSYILAEWYSWCRHMCTNSENCSVCWFFLPASNPEWCMEPLYGNYYTKNVKLSVLWDGKGLLCCVEMSVVVLLCRTTLEIVMFYAKRLLSVLQLP